MYRSSEASAAPLAWDDSVSAWTLTARPSVDKMVEIHYFGRKK